MGLLPSHPSSRPPPPISRLRGVSEGNPLEKGTWFGPPVSGHFFALSLSLSLLFPLSLSVTFYLVLCLTLSLLLSLSLSLSLSVTFSACLFLCPMSVCLSVSFLNLSGVVRPSFFLSLYLGLIVSAPLPHEACHWVPEASKSYLLPAKNVWGMSNTS